MKLTNRNNLSQAIYDAVANDDYTRGPATISITELLSPPRMRALKKKHYAELTEDVSDRIYSLLGKLMHKLLEQANRVAIAERRYYLDLDGEVISGGLDALYDDSRSLIQDYKLMSWYEVRDGLKEEKVQQLNCYAYLVKYGYYYEKADVNFTTKLVDPIDARYLQVVSFLRDWRKSQAGRDGMPDEQVVVSNVDRWTDEQQLSFLRERLALHKKAELELPECTQAERWASPDRWAAMSKPGAARSLKNHDLKEDAEQHVARVRGSGEHPKAFVEPRPGTSVRCESYCAVKEFCSQYRKLTNNGG